MIGRSLKMLWKPHTSNTLQNAVQYSCSCPQISRMIYFFFIEARSKTRLKSKRDWSLEINNDNCSSEAKTLILLVTGSQYQMKGKGRVCKGETDTQVPPKKSESLLAGRFKNTFEQLKEILYHVTHGSTPRTKFAKILNTLI